MFFNFWTFAHIFSLFPSLREVVHLPSIASLFAIALDPTHPKFLKDKKDSGLETTLPLFCVRRDLEGPKRKELFTLVWWSL